MQGMRHAAHAVPASIWRGRSAGPRPAIPLKLNLPLPQACEAARAPEPALPESRSFKCSAAARVAPAGPAAAPIRRAAAASWRRSRSRRSPLHIYKAASGPGLCTGAELSGGTPAVGARAFPGSCGQDEVCVGHR